MNSLFRLYKNEPIIILLISFLFREFSSWALLFMPSIWMALDILGFLIIFSCLLFTPKGNKFDGWINKFYRLFWVWTVFMVLRGSLCGNYPIAQSHNIYGVIKNMVANPYSGFSYLIPLVALMPFSFKSLSSMKKYAIGVSIVSLFFVYQCREYIAYAQLYEGVTDLSDERTIILRNIIETCYPLWGLVVFLLLCFNYIKSKYAYIIPISIFVYLICQAIGGGRGSTAYASFFLVAWIYLSFKFPIENRTGAVNSFNIRKIGIVFVSVSLVAFLYYLYENTNVFDFFSYRMTGGGSSLALFDNRDEIVSDMVSDFNKTPVDWIIGRGVNGAYQTSFYLAFNGQRDAMEYGYMYLILKGGIVFLFLNVLLFTHGAVKGLFQSRNLFSKALGLMCVSYLFFLISCRSEPQLASYFCLVWFAWGLVERKSIRMMDDKEIIGYFNK